MESTVEVGRIVSMLRSLMRGEIEACELAIRGGNLDQAHAQLSEVHFRISRAIYMLNRLR